MVSGPFRGVGERCRWQELIYTRVGLQPFNNPRNRFAVAPSNISRYHFSEFSSKSELLRRRGEVVGAVPAKTLIKTCKWEPFQFLGH